jgi:hypothetical protein
MAQKNELNTWVMCIHKKKRHITLMIGIISGSWKKYIASTGASKYRIHATTILVKTWNIRTNNNRYFVLE